MANTIKHKRGSGSDPTASDLSVGELAIRTDTGVVFTKKDDNSVVQISGSGGGGSSLTIQDEGSALSTDATTLNFTGGAVTATGSGATKTIDIRGGTNQADFGLCTEAVNSTVDYGVL